MRAIFVSWWARFAACVLAAGGAAAFAASAVRSSTYRGYFVDPHEAGAAVALGVVALALWRGLGPARSGD